MERKIMLGILLFMVSSMLIGTTVATERTTNQGEGEERTMEPEPNSCRNSQKRAVCRRTCADAWYDANPTYDAMVHVEVLSCKRNSEGQTVCECRVSGGQHIA